MGQNRIIRFFRAGPLWLKITKFCAVVAGVAGFCATSIDLYKGWKGKQIIEISGYVSENRESLVPVDAIVKMSSPFVQETETDMAGKYVFKLQDVDSDTFLFVIQHKKNQLETKEKHFISTKNGKYTFNIVFNPDVKDGKEYSIVESSSNPAFSNQRKPARAASSEKLVVKSDEVVNNTEKADFAVMTLVDGKQDGPMARKIIAWLQKKGSASQSVLQNLFIQQNYFNEIFDGNSSVIRKTKAAASVNYVCLARVKTDYGKSQVDESLVLAKCVYEIIIVDANTGKVMDSFERTEKASGISEEAALKRAETDFFTFLSGKDIQL